MTHHDCLLLFAGTILSQHRAHMGDVDGAAIQDAAIEAGLLEPRAMMEGCGADTCCADVKDAPWECYFLSPLGDEAIKAATPRNQQPQTITLTDGNYQNPRALTRADYEELKASGMLGEFYPGAPAQWPFSTS